MIAIIFEVWPAAGHEQRYFDLAAALKSELETMDGFISVERFRSLTEPGKLLSLSFWRDEAAVKRWRNLESHRAAQAEGRGGVFADYRLRVASIIRDYGLNERAEAPKDSRAPHG
ncbi:MAG: antibiotic biosynthesis monooxygenase family protein [Dongiaceae bacterium]